MALLSSTVAVLLLIGKATAGIHTQCGGRNWKGSTKCEGDLKCIFENPWFSSCAVVGDVPLPPAPPSTPDLVVAKVPSYDGVAAALDAPVYNWGVIDGIAYDTNNAEMPGFSWVKANVPSLAACQALCDAGCDFAIYQYGQCGTKLADLTDFKRTIFNGQTNGNYNFPGELRGTQLLQQQVVGSTAACTAACEASGQCQFVTIDIRDPANVLCELKKFQGGGAIATYRTNPVEQNYDPARLGRVDVIGNTGCVCIAASLLPNGKVLCTARPEYERGGPNPDNFAQASVPYGEIAAVFDPITGDHEPSILPDNIFCHGQILMEDGNMFTAGGDDNPDVGRPGGTGLINGLNGIRIFTTETNSWTRIVQMSKTRWYPTVLRTFEEKFLIIGGQVTGSAYVMQDNLEIYTMGDAQTTLVNSPLIANSYACNYPKMMMIPGSGNYFSFANKLWSVIDASTGMEVEQNFDWFVLYGARSNGLISGSVPVPMFADPGGTVSDAEFIFFGGGIDAF